jgi:hypothetical protein
VADSLAPNIQTLKTNAKNIEKSLKRLADSRLMVGIPASGAERKDPSAPINNAEIGYIMENGSPDANIPARPHLMPTMRENRGLIVKTLRLAAKGAFIGIDPRAALNGLGLTLVAAVKMKIREGVPPPLAESTVKARIARRKSKAYRAKKRKAVVANLAAGLAPGAGLFTPLIDTGDYIAHITYVIRKVGATGDESAGSITVGVK